MMNDIPKRHTSLVFCDRLRDNWTVFKTYVSAKGMPSMNQHVNTTLLYDFDMNYAKYMGNNKIGMTPIDYRNDSMDVMNSKITYFSDGQVYDDFKAISNGRLFLSREMKNRGMKF